MDTEQGRSPRPRQKLSVKLLKVVLLAACFLGVILSLIQVVIDARQSSQTIDTEARQMLAVIKEPALQAAYRHEPKMAEEILSGLMEHQSVHIVAIKLPDEPELAVVERPLSTSGYRQISDYIFDPVRIYRVSMDSANPGKKYVGELLMAVDTAYHGREFIKRSCIIVLSGLVRSLAMALMLYLIYTLVLTKPLNRLIRNLAQINPEQPGKHKLPMPESHSQNELGLWVRTANQLLESIERNFQLRQKAEARIMLLSQYDYLTRLPNRRTLQKQLQDLISHTDGQSTIAILCLGLDDFKYLNARLNFNAAEHILVKISDRLRNEIGSKAFIGRLGEDQFAVILPEMEHPYEAAELAQDMLRQLNHPFEISDEKITISATVGITLFPDDGQEVDNLLQQSEFAMIMAKSHNKNRYQFYIATIDTEIRQRKKLEMDLHQALEHHELSLRFQPQIDLRTSRIVGSEALLRWKHPDIGLIPPDMFIPMAENSMDIIPIGDWVLESACDQLHQWHQSGHKELKMAVNLSAVQLQDKSIVERVDYLLRKYQIPPGMLELEVTETSIMEDIETSSAQLHSLKETGVLLALDDFGTGYSSLSYLKKFPFDNIKIDKSFVEGLPENKENAVIVEAIIQLGKSFGLKVIAEGVETVEQEQHLKLAGCIEGQGYFYGKPMLKNELMEFIQNWKHQ